MIKLPVDFENRMQDMLGDAYPSFLESYENDKYQALRINPLKVNKEDFLSKVPFTLTNVPWEPLGFYYDNEEHPGKHPWHEAGAYYIQEPSAMAPAAYLEAKPGERVLDLCAAPGGKTTQIASYMMGEGLLVCNEIHPQRAKILSENVERLGIRNSLVTNETPAKLADTFDEFFDRILVDAPCSGEGMFRKNEIATDEWSIENVKLCADRQDEILDCADSMLRPGGRLVYSTCTFAPAENEGSMERFLTRHPNYKVLDVKKYDGMQPGIFSENMNLEGTIRLWPHLLKGEGHYMAVLQKDGEVPEGYGAYGNCRYGLETGSFAQSSGGKNKKNKNTGNDTLVDFYTFEREVLKDKIVTDESRLLLFGENLYLMPEGMPSIKGLKVLRPGLHLGTLKKNRFEPSHALALALKPEAVNKSYELTYKEPEASAFLGGQTLNYKKNDGAKGWFLITVDGYSLGWGKLAGAVMKNHYPKGLRKM